MIYALAAIASLSVAAPGAAHGSVPDLRIIRSAARARRYIRITSRTVFAGVTGRSVTVIDLATGRHAERVEAGILSFGDGFDGRRIWTSDVTGMPNIEGNADNRLDQLAWAHFYGRRGPEHPAVRRLRSASSAIVLRLQYPGLPTPLDVTLNARTRFVVRVEDVTGGERVVTTFLHYRTVAGVSLPYEARTTSRYGMQREYVTAVETVDAVRASAFEPPAPPNDTALDGVTSLPMRLGHGAPIVAARINGRPALRMLVDSGSTNLLTFAAARALGLRLTGDDKTGGIGPGVVRERFARTDVQIGDAVLRGQPFEVVSSVYPDTDGAIGCELFQRLAVQFDFENGYLRLARDARMFGQLGTPVAMRLNQCSPEIDGGFDAIAGPLAIDTGSAAALDVYTPVVRRYRLMARYRTSFRAESDGIGGSLVSYTTFAHRVRLGPKSVFDVPIELDVMESGAFATTTGIGNVGTSLLRAFMPTFDYRRGTLWLYDFSGGALPWPY